MKQKTNARVCMFCQQHARLTAEHVWPQWLGVEVGHGDGQVDTHQYTYSDSGRRKRTWTGAGPTNLKVKDVCAKCNNEWLSALETSTKSVLAPMLPAMRQLTVSPDDLIHIGRWAVKTSMMVDALRPAGQHFFFRGDVATFRQDYSLRRLQTNISLAANFATGPKLGTIYSQWPIPLRQIADHSIMTQSVGLSVTLVVWHVAIQTFFIRVRDDGGGPVTMRTQSNWARVAADITIPTRPILWPPSEVLRGDDLFEFAERFQKATRRSEGSTQLWRAIGRAREASERKD
jgi:hypothetical protein